MSSTTDRRPERAHDLIEDVPTYEVVSVSDLAVAEYAQRKFRPAWARKLSNKFDRSKFGVLTVNQRAPGTDGSDKIYVMDGQHRLWALRDRGEGEMKIRVRMFHGLTPQQEAEMFLGQNDALVVQGMDRYRVGLVAEREDALAIAKVVEDLELVVGSGKGDNRVGGIGTLYRVLEFGGTEVLEETLHIIKRTYGGLGFRASVIHGMGLVVNYYGEALDPSFLIQALKAVNGELTALVQKSNAQRAQYGGTLAAATAGAIVEIYNDYSPRSGVPKLQNWWSEKRPTRRGRVLDEDEALVQAS